MFQMSCISYSEVKDPRRSFQEYTSGISADSPQSLCCERLLRSLNLVSLPHDALNSGYPSFSATFVANSWMRGPSTGMRCSVFFLNHSRTASFTSEYCEVRLRFFALHGKSSFALFSYKSLLFQNVAYLCFSTIKFLSKFVYSCQFFPFLVFFNHFKTFF